ncbi:translation initiation factor IF-2-like [Vulpes lagopus]|uniref:translation initiation factor IF-2-like n=1 Tax=Vulpes lagopus TaxID=494514 RepID=UPI001BC991DB|nr:translation initiation factor IF-2-like [Vulpes lagopus]
MTGKKAEQAAREALTFAGKAPPLEEEKERLPGAGNAQGCPRRGAASPARRPPPAGSLHPPLPTPRATAGPRPPEAFRGAQPPSRRPRLAQQAICRAPATAGSGGGGGGQRTVPAGRERGRGAAGAAGRGESCGVARRSLRSARGGGDAGRYLRESRRRGLAPLGDPARPPARPRRRDPASPRGPAPATAAARTAARAAAGHPPAPPPPPAAPKSRGPSDALQICRDSPGSTRAPTCFKTKCEGGTSPAPAWYPPAPRPEARALCREPASRAPFLDLPGKAHAASGRRVGSPSEDGRGGQGETPAARG